MSPCHPLSPLNLAAFPASFPEVDHPLRAYDNQVIQIRGFLYPFTADDSLLAATPHLKSCCMGSSSLLYQQLVLKNFSLASLPQQVVTVEGIFHIDPIYSSEGKLIQLYTLNDVKPVPTQASPLPLIILVLLPFVCFSLYKALKMLLNPIGK